MATGTFETIVLEGDTILQTEEHVDETEVDAQLRQIADQMVNAAPDQATGAGSGALKPPRASAASMCRKIRPKRWSSNRPLRPDMGCRRGGGQCAAPALGLDRRRRRRCCWGSLGQIAHHHRQGLVAQAWAERPLRALYGLFGAELEPRWDLKAYDLRATRWRGAARRCREDRAAGYRAEPRRRQPATAHDPRDAAGPLRQCIVDHGDRAAGLPEGQRPIAHRLGPAPRCAC